MKQYRAAIAAVVMLTCAAPSRAGQTSPPPPVPSQAVPVDTGLLTPPDLLLSDGPERAAELARWVEDFEKWQQWSAQWRNRRQPGWLTSARERQAKPAPPAWLADRCVSVLDDTDPMLLACTRLAEWRDDSATARIRQVRVTTTSAQEAEPHMSWWKHVHLDVLWPAMDWRASVYGVAGLHVATEAAGRWQIFTAPGVLLLNVPSRAGTRLWKVAANYGIGYRLFDFTFPGGRPAQMHVNLAKTWLLSGAEDALTGRTTDLIGFSVTFKDRR
jgi:hypothetical protein